ncbi:MAG: hypothetical protein A2430_00425 [Candidatus Liptonbacteria bacterium RIFOXYC1_FULL_36_8]|uniref:Peptidase M50 domain-containing protein n=2 Tax=Candidatus Liptoniibacteriota TaxID=1817909 RepID=A0A1G2CMY5_9BACT|nr:MAG: hypothetical protein A2390_02380 [Candidatus Liptonbacteria bacterium RIFOXYB1_FULL_36_10]OGZ04059.1 MAG: hypothetical protein A2430_00425 [Candidatus Liptonbacteria bacterium RIFOXYC1_FULL_36_8]
MTYFIVFLGIAFLILAHEFGHFLSAKIFKVRVDEFGFGFPPKIWSKKIGETLYSLNILPFGGFVRIFGENREETEKEKKEEVVITETEIESVKESGEEIEIKKTEILEIKIENDEKRSFAFQSVWKRAVMLSAGVFMNVFFGWLLISFIFLIGSPSFVMTGRVLPDSPAFSAGFKEGDILVGYQKSADFISFINENKGKETIFKIKRGGEDLEIKATPKENTAKGEGALGILLAEGGIPKSSFGKNFIDSAKFTISALSSIFIGLLTAIKDLLLFKSTPAVVGPVGIFGIAYQVGQEGIIYLFHLFAVISLNLAVLNILPFPALDGGRLFFLFIEKIKGSPLPVKFENWANLTGFSLLLLFLIVITAKDILAFF